MANNAPPEASSVDEVYLALIRSGLITWACTHSLFTEPRLTFLSSSASTCLPLGFSSALPTKIILIIFLSFLYFSSCFCHCCVLFVFNITLLTLFITLNGPNFNSPALHSFILSLSVSCVSPNVFLYQYFEGDELPEATAREIDLLMDQPDQFRRGVCFSLKHACMITTTCVFLVF